MIRSLALFLGLAPFVCFAQTPQAPAELLVISSGGGSGGGGGDPASLIYRLDFQDAPPFALVYGTGLGSSLNVGDEGLRGVCNGTNLWNYTHFSNGAGYGGRNYVNYRRCAGPDGAPNVGWTWGNPTVAMWSSYSPGPLYYRFRMRINTPVTAAVGHAASKFHIFGGPGLANGCDRLMIMLYAGSNNGGTDSEEMSVGVVQGVCGDQQDAAPTNNSDGSAFAFIPADGQWHHFQAGVRWGVEGVSWMRVWIDNNAEGSPTASTTQNYLGCSSPPCSWNFPGIQEYGAFGDIVSDNSETGQNADWDLQDFEVGTQFNGDWAP